MPWSRRLLERYRLINDELWRAYQRGEIDPASLAKERFCRLLTEMGRDAAHGGPLGEAYLEEIARAGDLLPRARSTLDALRRRFRLGAVTNGIDRIAHARLAASGLDRRFEVVVTADACGFAKPDPRIMHAALTAMGVGADEVVYVGNDLKADGGAAAAAGVRFWWMDHGLPAREDIPVERAIRDLRELLALLPAPR